MSDDVVPVTNLKKQRHRNRCRCRNKSAEEHAIAETLSESLEKTLKNLLTPPRKEDGSTKFVHNNSSKKCVQTMTKSCTSTVCERTLENKIKHDTKKADIKSNSVTLLQEKSEKLKEKVKAQSGKESNNAKSKGKIRQKIKQNKNKLTSLEETLLLNDNATSPGTSQKQKEESCIKKSVKCVKTINFKEEFPESIPVPEIKKILKSKESNLKYVEGYIHINPKYYKHAYVSMSDEIHDLLIIGIRDRNGALEGDLVVAIINEEDKWETDKNGKKQKTGTVVCILEKVHSRKAVGWLKTVGTIVFLQPRDIRLPLIKLYPETLPPNYNKMPSLFDNVLFLATIKSWKKPYSAYGKVERMIGTVGDLEVELNAIILENGINTQPFNDKLLKELQTIENSFTSTDIKEREDWRNNCVFTIDPSTAVDLDDAVSCTVMTNGNYEVGVHIADVAHYLKFFSPLDKEIAKRATTVYLAHQVYHMLPHELCKMCSLLPGEDKLTFSVIWEITPDAQIVKHRFAKTIINSCCQMTYEQAQMIIENSKCFPNDILKIEGNFTPRDLCKVVEDLFKLSEKIRMKRFADGALRIDQPKLHIVICKESGLPISYNMSEQKDSNRLIEEFMLLANMTVATHLFKTIPEYALLRNHGDPSERLLIIAQNILRRFGIHLDIESSGDLYTSIKRYEICTELESEEYKYLTKCRLMVINKLCAKAMARATYNCSSTVKNIEQLRHYALNVPFYTHFTSPIRRYPDIVVHRLLHSTLSTKVKLPRNWNSKLCSEIAKNCNLRKYHAKLAEEQSIQLYFTYFIDITGQRTVAAIVFDVKEHSIEVILCETGIKAKIYLNQIEKETTIKYNNEYSVPTLTVTWKVSNVTQVITVFTIVHLRIEKDTDHFQLHASLLEPSQNHDH